MPCDLIHGWLRWAPETAPRPEEAAIAALSLCENQAGRGASQTDGVYQVHHYCAKAYGRAFGPLGLEQTLRFCSNLARVLPSRSPGAGGGGGGATALTVWTPPGEEAAHTNASVLIGAYLIFFEGWDADQLEKRMGGAEAQRAFPCSWSRCGTPEAKRNLHVLDCWQGFVLARKLGWLDARRLYQEGSIDEVCARCHHLVACYDAGWLIPGQILVSADPVTTLLDPNPETFMSLEPTGSTSHTPSTTIGSDSGERDRLTTADENDFRLEDAAVDLETLTGVEEDSVASPLAIDPLAPRGALATDAAAVTALGTPASLATAAPAPRRPSMEGAKVWVSESRTSESVAKDYTRNDPSPAAQRDPLRSREGPADFVTFLRTSGVGLVIRANFDREPGMQGCSYDPAILRTHGLEHVDVPWEDHKGACPQKAHVARFMEACCGYITNNPEERPEAILVHCKGGFGRSVLLACVLMVERFDVSGRAVMGWARVARPGAINTPDQEKLIASLSGRADVWRLAGRAAPLEAAEKKRRQQSGCIGTACHIQ